MILLHIIFHFHFNPYIIWVSYGYKLTKRLHKIITRLKNEIKILTKYIKKNKIVNQSLY